MDTIRYALTLQGIDDLNKGGHISIDMSYLTLKKKTDVISSSIMTISTHPKYKRDFCQCF